MTLGLCGAYALQLVLRICGTDVGMQKRGISGVGFIIIDAWEGKRYVLSPELLPKEMQVHPSLGEKLQYYPTLP